MSSRAFMEELCNNAGGYSRLVSDTLGSTQRMRARTVGSWEVSSKLGSPPPLLVGMIPGPQTQASVAVSAICQGRHHSRPCSFP